MFLQLKDMADRLPPGTYDSKCTAALEDNGIHHSRYSDSNSETHSRSNSITAASLLASSSSGIDSTISNGIHGYNARIARVSPPTSSGASDCSEIRRLQMGEKGHCSSTPDGSELGDGDSNSVRSSSVASAAGDSGRILVEAEWIEQYEPGVYITLMALQDGTRDLKRVRFRYFSFLSLLNSFPDRSS